VLSHFGSSRYSPLWLPYAFVVRVGSCVLGSVLNGSSVWCLLFLHPVNGMLVYLAFSPNIILAGFSSPAINALFLPRRCLMDGRFGL